MGYSTKGKGYSPAKGAGSRQYGASFPGSYKGAVATYESRLTVKYGNGQSMTYEQRLTMPLLPGQGLVYQSSLGMPNQMYSQKKGGLENRMGQYQRKEQGKDKAYISDAFKYGEAPLENMKQKYGEKQQGQCVLCHAPASYGNLCFNCLHKN